jgi:hypothetical protein
METTEKELTAEERHERVIAFLKRHMAEKRREEAEMVEKYKTDQVFRAKIAELKRQNGEV